MENKKLRACNLYCGIGGNRKLWTDVDVTAVELDPEIAAIYQSYFPDDTVIVGDAHQYLLDHYKQFDFIWASPPCPTHSRMNVNFNIVRYADMKLYQEIILLKTYFKGQYCVENVVPYYEPLIQGTRYNRHYYWTNFVINEQKGNAEYSGIIKNHRKHFNGKHKQKTLSLSEKAKIKGINNLNELVGVDKNKVINNCVNPKDGLYILNCARNIITKQNIQQTELFE